MIEFLVKRMPDLFLFRLVYVVFLYPVLLAVETCKWWLEQGCFSYDDTIGFIIHGKRRK